MRRSMQHLVSKDACAKHLQIQEAEASQLMYDLLQHPEAYYKHVERYVMSTMLTVVFGLRCSHAESSPISEFSALEVDWENLIIPGHHPPVDLFPVLRLIPERWAQWKTICRNLKARQEKLYFGLLESCERRMTQRGPNGCFLEKVLQERDKLGLTWSMIA